MEVISYYKWIELDWIELDYRIHQWLKKNGCEKKNLWFYRKPLGRSHWKLVTAMAAERLTMD